MTTADALPEDMPSLRAAAVALIAERDALLSRIERMQLIIGVRVAAEQETHRAAGAAYPGSVPVTPGAPALRSESRGSWPFRSTPEFPDTGRRPEFAGFLLWQNPVAKGRVSRQFLRRTLPCPLAM